MQKGFITIPVLIIIILSTVVAGGGGYAVYKVNQIEHESSSRVTELEKKIEEASKPATVVETMATTTKHTDVKSEEPDVPKTTQVLTPAAVQVAVVPSTAPTIENIEVQTDRWGFSEADWEYLAKNLRGYEKNREFYNEEESTIDKIEDDLFEYRDVFVFFADYYNGTAAGDSAKVGLEKARNALAQIPATERQLSKVKSVNASIIHALTEKHGETLESDMASLNDLHANYMSSRNSLMDKTTEAMLLINELRSYYDF